MKNILKVTILFCFIISCFVVPSFASDVNWADYILPNLGPNKPSTSQGFMTIFDGYSNANNGLPTWQGLVASNSDTTYVFALDNYGSTNNRAYIVSKDSFKAYTAYNRDGQSYQVYNAYANYSSQYYYYNASDTFGVIYNATCFIPTFATFDDAIDDLNDYLENGFEPTPSFTKNSNVDEFIANTMISMGVKFDTPAYALSYASAAWNWCIDEDNMESANPFDEWNIESFVSYCNAQSNNYLNWYNGYKASKDVTNALGEYIRQNIQLLNGLPSGVTSLTSAYMPIHHYGSGFNSGASSPTAQTFYPAQTITYFNGEYVNETDDISTSQFLYTPADVRRFLGYPGTSPVITPSSPTGTGTITDDPNNPGQKNITINFPALDWLADAIKSILDFLRDAFTTLANLLTQLLDAILGLFSDAFESLQDFGQGIIDFIQSVFSGLSDLLSGYVPSDISVIIVTFIALNFGVGLITFVLKGH